MNTQSNTPITLTPEEVKANTLKANATEFGSLYSDLQKTVKAWFHQYEQDCAERNVVPEFNLNEVSDQEVDAVVNYLLHSQGIRTEGTVQRNWAERWLLYYPSFAVGTIAGSIDSLLTHIPGYSKNIKAGFNAGAGFGHFVERKLYEGARNKCVSSKERMTQAYENRKKEKVEEESTAPSSTAVPSPV